LQGVTGVQLVGTGLNLRLNRTTGDSGKLLDWTQTGLAEAAVAVTSSESFRIGGTAGMSIADVVVGSAAIAVERRQVSGVVDPDSGGARQFEGDLFMLRITDATLFVGSGATLNLDRLSPGFGTATIPSVAAAGVVGFTVEGGELDLGVFTARSARPTGSGSYMALAGGTPRYTGMEGSLGRARLIGVPDLRLVGTGLSLEWNRTSVVDDPGTEASEGQTMDWTQGAVANVGAGEGPGQAGPLSVTGMVLTSGCERLWIGGKVGVAIADVAFASGIISVTRSEVAGVGDPDAAGATLSGTLLSLVVTEGRVFVGAGASLVEDLTREDFGGVRLPTNTSADAVGFAVEAVTLKVLC
jgi:hypothetical protein